MKPNNRGFSLVELIVVIAIMAVLVGLLAPQFIKYVEKSRMSIDIQNIQNLCHVVETYAANVNEHNETIPDTASLTLDCTGIISVDDYWRHALDASEITDCRLRSSVWFDSGATSITITANNLNGMPSFSETNVASTLSLLNGDTIADN